MEGYKELFQSHELAKFDLGKNTSEDERAAIEYAFLFCH